MRARYATAVITAAAVLAGCGSSSSSSTVSTASFKQAFATQKASFQKLGRDLGTAIQTAPKRRDQALATEFATLSSRASAQASALRGLQVPSRFQSEVTRLAGAFDTVAADLKKISGYASTHNPGGARAAAQTLVVDAAALKKVDVAITGQLGLPQSQQ